MGLLFSRVQLHARAHNASAAATQAVPAIDVPSHGESGGLKAGEQCMIKLPVGGRHEAQLRPCLRQEDRSAVVDYLAMNDQASAVAVRQLKATEPANRRPRWVRDYDRLGAAREVTDAGSPGRRRAE